MKKIEVGRGHFLGAIIALTVMVAIAALCTALATSTSKANADDEGLGIPVVSVGHNSAFEITNLKGWASAEWTTSFEEAVQVPFTWTNNENPCARVKDYETSNVMLKSAYQEYNAQDNTQELKFVFTRFKYGTNDIVGQFAVTYYFPKSDAASLWKIKHSITGEVVEVSVDPEAQTGFITGDEFSIDVKSGFQVSGSIYNADDPLKPIVGAQVQYYHITPEGEAPVPGTAVTSDSLGNYVINNIDENTMIPGVIKAEKEGFEAGLSSAISEVPTQYNVVRNVMLSPQIIQVEEFDAAQTGDYAGKAMNLIAFFALMAAGVMFYSCFRTSHK